MDAMRSVVIDLPAQVVTNAARYGLLASAEVERLLLAELAAPEPGDSPVRVMAARVHTLLRTQKQTTVCLQVPASVASSADAAGLLTAPELERLLRAEVKVRSREWFDEVSRRLDSLPPPDFSEDDIVEMIREARGSGAAAARGS